MADIVNAKVEKVENITIELIKVRISFYFLHSFVHIYSENQLEDLQKDTAVAHDHNQQTAIRELI
jgi:hypothetical protein